MSSVTPTSTTTSTTATRTSSSATAERTCSSEPYEYGWRRKLEWPFGMLGASTRNPLGIEPVAFPHGAREGARVGFLGDIMPQYRERLIEVDASIRAKLRSFEALVLNLEAPVLDDATFKDSVDGLRLSFSRDMANQFLDALGTDPKTTYVSMGNNHATDYGAEQFHHTLDFLARRGHPVIGVSDHGKLGIAEVPVGGVRIGLLGWTYWLNHGWPGACSERRPTTQEDILGVSFEPLKAERRLDLLVLFSHWGYENKHFPRSPFGQLAKQMVGLGADVNVGAHPHVIAPLQKIGPRYVHYSVGDFMSLQWMWHNQLGSIFEMVVRKTSNGVELGFDSTPVYKIERGDRSAVVPLEQLSTIARNRALRRLALVHPRVLFASPEAAASGRIG